MIYRIIQLFLISVLLIPGTLFSSTDISPPSPTVIDLVSGKFDLASTEIRKAIAKDLLNKINSINQLIAYHYQLKYNGLIVRKMKSKMTSVNNF